MLSATLKNHDRLRKWMTNLARRVSIRLGLFERGLDFALRQIPASVLVILLSGLGDVNRRGLWVLSEPYRWLLGNDVLDRRNEQKRCEQNE
jgi:hypothetical protein